MEKPTGAKTMKIHEIMPMVLDGDINEFNGYIHSAEKTWFLTISWEDSTESYLITLKEVDKQEPIFRPAEVKFV
jgi:hypothetical protein